MLNRKLFVGISIGLLVMTTSMAQARHGKKFKAPRAPSTISKKASSSASSNTLSPDAGSYSESCVAIESYSGSIVEVDCSTFDGA